MDLLQPQMGNRCYPLIKSRRLNPSIICPRDNERDQAPAYTAARLSICQAQIQGLIKFWCLVMSPWFVCEFVPFFQKNLPALQIQQYLYSKAYIPLPDCVVCVWPRSCLCYYKSLIYSVFLILKLHLAGSLKMHVIYDVVVTFSVLLVCLSSAVERINW